MQRYLWALVMTVVTPVAVLAAPAKKVEPRAAAKAAASSVAPVARAIPEAGTLSENDLVQIARMASKEEGDKFAAPATAKYIGRAFEVAIPTDSLTVEYDKASQILSVKLWSYSDAVRFRREVKESTYKGQNAYGATTTVVKSRGAMYGFAIPGSSYSRKDIIFSKTLEPAAAKALSEKIVLRFKGNLIASEGVWKIDGTPVQNRPVVSEATVSNPSDIFVQYYQVTGKIDTADWVDSRTGEVLGTISSPKF